MSHGVDAVASERGGPGDRRGCVTDESSASPPDVATLETSAVPTAAATTLPVAPTNTASSTDVVLTTSSGAVARVPTTVASTEPLDAGAVSEGLGEARVRWSDADIASYRLTVAGSRSIWGVGLHLVHRGL